MSGRDIFATLGARFDAEFPEAEAVNLDRGMTIREMAKLGPEPWRGLPDGIAELARLQLKAETTGLEAVDPDRLMRICADILGIRPEPPCTCGSQACEDCWPDDMFCDDAHDDVEGEP